MQTNSVRIGPPVSTSDWELFITNIINDYTNADYFSGLKSLDREPPKLRYESLKNFQSLIDSSLIDMTVISTLKNKLVHYATQNNLIYIIKVDNIIIYEFKNETIGRILFILEIVLSNEIILNEYCSYFIEELLCDGIIYENDFIITPFEGCIKITKHNQV